MKTFKTVLSASLLALVSFNAFAGEEISVERRVMRELVGHASQYTIVSAEGTEYETKYNLADVVAGALLGGYLSAKNNSLVLSDTSITCEKTVGARGRDELDCNVNFLDGDFEVKKDGKFEGPITESSISFQVPAVIENGKVRILSKKLKGFLAG